MYAVIKWISWRWWCVLIVIVSDDVDVDNDDDDDDDVDVDDDDDDDDDDVVVWGSLLAHCPTLKQNTQLINKTFLQIMVSYHDMRNISYITQDPEDRKVFAYIAKDAKTEKHYCHVFRVESTVSQ